MKRLEPEIQIQSAISVNLTRQSGAANGVIIVVGSGYNSAVKSRSDPDGSRDCLLLTFLSFDPESTLFFQAMIQSVV